MSSALPDLDLGSQLIEISAQKIGSLFGEVASGFGLHRVGEGEKFGVKMIEAVFGILGSAGFAKRIFRMVKRRTEVATQHEAAAEADRTKSIESIGILQNAGFRSLGWDFCGKAMGADGVMNGLEVNPGIIGLAEKGDGLIGGNRGSTAPLGGVFGDGNAIVQVGGGEEDVEREIFGLGEASGVHHHPFNMGWIVSGVAVGLGGQKIAEDFDPEWFTIHGPVELQGWLRRVPRFTWSAACFCKRKVLEKTPFRTQFCPPGARERASILSCHESTDRYS